VAPIARAQPASLDGLLAIARDCGTSLESTAFQLTQAYWPCSFIFWEPRLKPTERISQQQTAFAGWDGQPTERLRVVRGYRARGLPFLPPEKSVDEGTSIYRALQEQGRAKGDEILDTGSQQFHTYCESEYAPYYDDTGVLRARVVSYIQWTGFVRGKVAAGRNLFDH
jgi:hypothetical protein